MMPLCTAGTIRARRRSESVVEFAAKPIDVFDAMWQAISSKPVSTPLTRIAGGTFGSGNRQVMTGVQPNVH
jgi:hypothetical protein